MWLWGSMTAAQSLPSGTLQSAGVSVRLAELARKSIFGGQLEKLRGRIVLLMPRDQLTAALALIELDGIAQRVVLCPPDLSAEHLALVVKDAGANACVADSAGSDPSDLGITLSIIARPQLAGEEVARGYSQPTEWVLLTSGTTGAPKLVLHSLASLTSAFAREPPTANPPVWSTFYDIRRYGGLQILLRAVHAGSMVLSAADESVAEFLTRAGAASVTHMSGTPSHWRRALMSGSAGRIAPRAVRLSGEIADQGILDSLRAAYPHAAVAHAFASTEAGVAFEVGDGLAGFPANMIGTTVAGVELRVSSGTLQIRSPGNASRYLGAQAPALKHEDGFVDTGDRVELHGGRYHFVGRSGGVINVGGLKVHPEEVEAVINAHPWVRMSLVRARRSPITGAMVTAEVVLADAVNGRAERPGQEGLTREIIELCRRMLPPHKVPAMIRIVPALEMSASGKLVRPNA